MNALHGNGCIRCWYIYDWTLIRSSLLLEQMMRYNERVREATERIMCEEQRRANQSPIVDIPATDATIPVKSVHIRSYTQTTQLIKDEIDRLRISTNTVSKTKNMREMHVALQASGLLTLLLEQRTMKKPSVKTT